MPSDQSTWLIAVPQDDESDGLVQSVSAALSQFSGSKSSLGVAALHIPSFKTGTLESLISLSEDLPKQDAYFTSIVAKVVDTLRNLLNNDPSKLAQHIQVNDASPDDYVLGRGQGGWKWNEARYGLHKGLRDLLDLLQKEMSSIDNISKSKLTNYNLAKGSLVQLQRKKAGNLSVRSLVDIVPKEVFVQDSEYLETLLVAVPKTISKEWNAKYERLAPMVVPRSSTKISEDEEFVLFSVVIFKRHKEEFAQRCRENKFILRDFTYSGDLAAKQQVELSAADETERELWTELLRLSRTNFSETFQLLVHLKVLRIFVESVLRYGLPAHYAGIVVKPEPRAVKKSLQYLTDRFSYLAPRSNAMKSKTKQKAEDAEGVGEYQQLMEQEFLDFVLFEVPWITN